MAEQERASEYERWQIQFREPHNFGLFCVQLRADGVPFGLCGFHTILIYRIDFERLPATSRALYEESLADGRIVAVAGSTPDLRGSYHMVDTEEAIRELRERAEKYYAP